MPGSGPQGNHTASEAINTGAMTPAERVALINSQFGYVGDKAQWGILPGEDLAKWQARVGPEIEQFRRQHGDWPGSPRDPMTLAGDDNGKAIIYNTMNGFRQGDAGYLAPGSNIPVSATPIEQTEKSNLDRQKKIDAFYAMMMNPNDPSLLAAQDRASARSQMGSAGKGIIGGLAQSTNAKAGMDSRNALLTQRQGIGMSALQGGLQAGIGMQSNMFDQNQSNQINAWNQNQAGLQALASAGGQVVSGLTGLLKDYTKSGTPNYGNSDYYKGNYDGAIGNVPNYGGVGSYDGGMDPSDLSNPFPTGY